MTQLTLYLSCVLITGHSTCRQHKISNCFYCCVSREITTKANNIHTLMSAVNVTMPNFRLIVIILSNLFDKCILNWFYLQQEYSIEFNRESCIKFLTSNNFPLLLNWLTCTEEEWSWPGCVVGPWVLVFVCKRKDYPSCNCKFGNKYFTDFY